LKVIAQPVPWAVTLQNSTSDLAILQPTLQGMQQKSNLKARDAIECPVSRSARMAGAALMKETSESHLNSSSP